MAWLNLRADIAAEFGLFESGHVVAGALEMRRQTALAKARVKDARRRRRKGMTVRPRVDFALMTPYERKTYRATLRGRQSPEVMTARRDRKVQRQRERRRAKREAH